MTEHVFLPAVALSSHEIAIDEKMRRITRTYTHLDSPRSSEILSDVSTQEI